MTTTGLTLTFTIFVAMTTATLLRAFSIDAENIRELMDNCGDPMYKLTICLRKESSFGLKFPECDDLLVQTLVCLSTKPDVPFMHAQQPEMNDVIVPGHPDVFLTDLGDGLVSKRGLGRCIHNCLQGRGGLNFIQCKSMCRR